MSIIVYSMNGCASCVAAINLLKNNNKEFEVIKIEDDPASWEWIKAAGKRSMPQIVIDGQFVEGGFQGLKQLAEEGKL